MAPSHPRYRILSSYAFLVARDNSGNGVEEKGRGGNGIFKRYEVEIFREILRRGVLMNQWLLIQNDDESIIFRTINFNIAWRRDLHNEREDDFYEVLVARSLNFFICRNINAILRRRKCKTYNATKLVV